jgi:uncharacterized protein
VKFILSVVAIVALLWLLRRSVQRAVGRAADARPAAGPGAAAGSPSGPAALAEPQTMLACGLCGLHLPRDEALPGRGGVFCGEAHRRAYEQAHPQP